MIQVCGKTLKSSILNGMSHAHFQVDKQCISCNVCTIHCVAILLKNNSLASPDHFLPSIFLDDVIFHQEYLHKTTHGLTTYIYVYSKLKG